MKFRLNKIFFILLLSSGFPAHAQDQCMFYPEECRENRFDPRCAVFPDHCSDPPSERTVTEMDPYCDRYPDECEPSPPPPGREEILALPSATDQLPLLNQNLSEEDKQSSQVYNMALVQNFQENPDVYWAFEFAARGSTAYQHFEQSNSSRRIRQSALRFISNFEFNLPGGVTISPDFSDSRTGQRQFQDFKPEMEHITDIASQITNLYFLCEEQTFDCPNFHDYFQGTDIDSQDLANTLDKALEYGYQNSSFPKIKDWENLQLLYPQAATVVTKIQESQNNNEQMEIIKEAVALHWKEDQEASVAHIKATDPFYTGQEDLVILDLDNKGELYKQELQETNQKLSSPTENISQEEIRKLYEEQKKYKTAIDKIEKAKELRKHKVFTARASAWIGAVTAVAQTTGMPEEAVKLGQAAGIGMNIYDAGMSMIISGALDPTGITAMANGMSALINIMFDIPSAQEIMQESLNKIHEKLDTVLENQEKMLGKLDHISAHLDYMTKLMQRNHADIMNNLTAIEQQLNQIQTSMQFGFNTILSDHKRQGVQSVLRTAYGYIQALSSNPYNFNCTNNNDDEININCLAITQTRNNARVLLGTMSQTLEQISKSDKMKDFSKLSKIEIEEYLENPSIEDRLFFLPSMVDWLNNTGERIYTTSDEDDRARSAYLSLLGRYYLRITSDHGPCADCDSHLPSTNDYLRSRFTENNENDWMEWRKNLLSNINFGANIPKLPQNIMFPSYQDQIFSQYIQLASVLPPNEDQFGNVYDQNINQMCQRISNIESLSKIMRENIQKAWTIYHIYSLIIDYYIGVYIQRSMFYGYNSITSSRFRLKLKAASQKYEETAQAFTQNNFKDIPHIFRQGYISSFKHLDATSEYFTNFANIVNKKLDQELNDWDNIDFMYYGYGYIKKVPRTRTRRGGDCLKWGSTSAPPEMQNVAGAITTSLNWATTSAPSGVKVQMPGGPPGPQIYLDRDPPPRCIEWKQEQYTIYLDRGDKEAFKRAQIKEWSWYPTYVYTNIIRTLNKENLILDWMRAKLAVDTMAQIGYGNTPLSLHPELSILNKLIKTLPARREPFPINENFNPQTKVLSPLELNQISQFLTDIESILIDWKDYPLIDYAKTTANRINSHYNDSKISPWIFINNNFCETKNFRVRATILNAQSIIQVLNSSNLEEINKKFTNFYIEKEKSPTFDSLEDFIEFLHSTLDGAVTNYEPLDLIQYIESHNLQFLLDLLPEAHRWKSPLCNNNNNSEAEQNKHYQKINQPFTFSNPYIGQYVKQHLKQSIEKFHKVVPNGNLSLIYHLPLPSEDLWQNQPVGLGLYELRHQALLKAELFEHLKPQNCSINTQ